MIDPLLKWPGGKRNLAEKVRRTFDSKPKGRYIEPFCGSMAVFLHRLNLKDVTLKQAVMSDANPQLIHFYRMVQAAPSAFLQELRKLPVEGEWQKHFPDIRDRINNWTDPESPKYAAAYLWYNKACFNGLMRVNKDGKYNAPIGSYERVILPSESEIRAFSEAIDGLDLRIETFDEVIGYLEPGDQVYLDPPYHEQFSQYTGEGFRWADQVRLSLLAEQGRRAAAQVVISNAGTDEIRSLYGAYGWAIIEVQADRSISCTSEGRGKKGEILVVCSKKRK